MFGFDDISDANGGGGANVCPRHPKFGEGSLAHGGISAALLGGLFSIDLGRGFDGSCNSAHDGSSSNSNSSGRITIALSSWILRGQQIVE